MTYTSVEIVQTRHNTTIERPIIVIVCSIFDQLACTVILHHISTGQLLWPNSIIFMCGNWLQVFMQFLM